jgi:hypothetical protein
MGTADILLGWRPAVFWRATPVEFWTAIKAFERANPQSPS